MHDGWFINTEIDEIGSIPGMAMEYGLESLKKDGIIQLSSQANAGRQFCVHWNPKDMDDLNLGVSSLQNRVLLRDCASMIFRMVFLGVHVARIHVRISEIIARKESGTKSIQESLRLALGAKLFGQRFHFLINFVHGILSQKGPFISFISLFLFGGQWNHVFLGHGMCHHHWH